MRTPALGRPRELARRLLRLAKPGALIHLGYWRGNLVQEGWFPSYKKSQAVDRSGDPIPWFSYPAIHFLDHRLRRSFRVFEFGCGNSTLWFADRVQEIISVEHDPQWATTIARTAPPNVRIIERPEGASYPAEVANHKPVEVVVVDGVQRDECTIASLEHLNSEGVIVWDNPDYRPEYPRVLPELQARGFREILFWGMAPILTETQCTAILYRSQNCLGI